MEPLLVSKGERLKKLWFSPSGNSIRFVGWEVENRKEGVSAISLTVNRGKTPFIENLVRFYRLTTGLWRRWEEDDFIGKNLLKCPRRKMELYTWISAVPMHLTRSIALHKRQNNSGPPWKSVSKHTEDRTNLQLRWHVESCAYKFPPTPHTHVQPYTYGHIHKHTHSLQITNNVYLIQKYLH